MRHLLPTIGLGLALAACGVPPAASTEAPRSPAAPATAGAAASASRLPAPSPVDPPPTLPPGVEFVHDGALAPGTYWFRGFVPWLQLEVDGPGWDVGHFRDELFDLFLDGDFPAIGFARFPSVSTPSASTMPGGATVSASSIDAILDAWRSSSGIEVVDLGPITIAGLSGRAVEVSVGADQTPLFGAASEAFRFDPGLDSRFHLLEVDGGVLEVFVIGRAGQLEAAIERTRPILESVRVIE